MSDDINQLSAFMNQDQPAAADTPGVGSSAATASQSVSMPTKPSADIDQLSSFMNNNGAPAQEPSIADQMIQGVLKHGPQVKDIMDIMMGSPAVTPEDLEKRKAMAEAVASGATLGGSRLAENSILGNQVDQARRARNNEDITSFGNAIGGAGAIAATGGVGTPLEALGVSGLAKAGLAGALDTGILTAGNVVSDQALGNPDLNAQKLGSALWDAKGDIGTSMLFGGTLGILAHSAGSFLTKNGLPKDSIADHIEQNQNETSLPIVNNEAPPVEISPDSPFKEAYDSAIKSTNIAEMEKALSRAKAMGMTTELPQKSAVIDAESRLGDMQLPLNKIQVDSLDSQAARDQLGVLKQLNIKGGGTLADFEAAQKAERLQATDSTIKSLAPNYEVTSDLHDSGQKIINDFTENYQQKQAALAPVLQDIKSLETQDPFNHQPGVIRSMSNRVPGVASMFDTTGEKTSIKPYSTSWGIDRATYDAVSQAHKALEEPAFIQELMNVRNGLEQNINIQQPGRAAAQIRQLKAGMMDYIQDQIGKVEPSLPPEANIARETLRDWAINEGQREVIEKAFGASVGTPEFSQLSRVNPEKILDKVFSDTSHVKAARQILGEKKFNETVANYLSAARENVTKDGAFSSNKFYSFLNKKRYALGEAMSSPGNSQAMQKINDLNTTMRNFSDAGPTNNSKTAQTLVQSGLLNKAGSIMKNLGTGEFRDALDEFKEPILGKLRENAQRKAINRALEGKPERLNKMGAVKKMTDSVDDKISTGIRAILSGTEPQIQRRRRQ